MSGAVVLIALGTMVILLGLLVLAAVVAGYRLAPARLGRRRDTAPRGGRAAIATPRQWVLAVAVGIVALLLTGWVAIGVGAGAAVIGVPIVISKGPSETQISRLDGLAAWTRRLADMLTSGSAASLDTAIRKSAAAAPPQMAKEIDTLAFRLSPWGVQRALLGFAHDLADGTVDSVAIALINHERNGGAGISNSLYLMADNLEETTRVRREIEADRAEPRSTARTLIVITVVVLTAMVLFFKSFLEPYNSVLGQALLVVIVGIFAVSLIWMWRIVRPPTTIRLLTPADFEEAGVG